MKSRIIIAAAGLMLAAAPLHAQEVTYALPKTAVMVEVTAKQEAFTAGKYASYAKELLNLDVCLSDTVVNKLSEVEIRSNTEADLSRRYTLTLNGNSRPLYTELTKQGLVCSHELSLPEAGGKVKGWSAPSSPKPAEKPKKPSVYEERVVTTTDSLGNVFSSIVYVEVEPVDSLYLEAKDKAETILELRDQRKKIITGDTDASYSGEALGAAVKEINRLEKELLTLFTGKTRFTTKKAVFTVIPEQEGTFRVFTLDGTMGPVKPSTSSENVFELTVKAEPIAQAEPATASAKKHPHHYITYRIPAICELTLTDGAYEVLSVRLPVYQLGIECTYPIYE